MSDRCQPERRKQIEAKNQTRIATLHHSLLFELQPCSALQYRLKTLIWSWPSWWNDVINRRFLISTTLLVNAYVGFQHVLDRRSNLRDSRLRFKAARSHSRNINNACNVIQALRVSREG